MVHTKEIRTIVGIIGNVISLCLFLSPVPTFVRIMKAKSVEEFKADPYVATLLNCAMWVLYGLPFVHPDSFLVLSINAVGFGIQVLYATIFLVYSDSSKRSMQKRIFIALAIETIFFAGVAIVTLTALHTTKRRSMLVGIICIVLNIIMYISPLTIMGRVIKTKSVKYMPFYLSLANFANGGIWLAYALLKFDMNVLIPNGLGALSGAIQLVLYATYYRTTKWVEEEEEEGKAVEVQLQVPQGKGKPVSCSKFRDLDSSHLQINLS